MKYITLYAKWTINQYTYNITYKSTSGKSLGTSTITRSYGAVVQVPAPAKTGYNTPAVQTITWNVASNGGKTITFTYTPITYTITYDFNGGSLSGQRTSYNIESTAYTLPSPTKQYNSFLGWTGTNGTTAQKSVTIPAGSTGNKSYKANWVLSEWRYKVVLNYNSTTNKDFDGANKTQTATIYINSNNTRSWSGFGNWQSGGNKCWWGDDKTLAIQTGFSVVSVEK